MRNLEIKPKRVASCLLGSQDYILIDSTRNKFLFLSESLKIFKISDPSILEYLRLCETGKTDGTYLTDKTIKNIGQTLNQAKPIEETGVHEDLSHSFLILNVTNGCNLACKYCFANVVRKNHNTMSLDTAKAAIDNMLNQKTQFDEYTIYFFGGEPMLKLSLVKQVVEYAEAKITGELGRKIQFLLNTNGTLFNSASVDFFKKYNFRVTISIDGPIKQHDTNRIYRNGKGSFNKVMDGVRMLKENSVSTNLRATFNPYALDLLDTFKFFEDLQLPYAYSFTINNDYKSNADDTFFEEKDYKTVKQEMKLVMDYFITKIRAAEPVYCSGIFHKLNAIKYKVKRKYACEAGRRSITVDENGKYYACQNMIPYQKTALGHVSYEIVEEQRKKYMSKDLATLSQCKDCTIRNLCGGGCEIERISSDQSPRQQMCQFFKIEWENILYIYSELQD